MTVRPRRLSLSLAMAAAFAAALALSACGRKGDLDPPPSALGNAPSATAGNAATQAPAPAPKHLPIDVLLD